MILGRPIPLGGAFVDPKSSRLDQMQRTVREVLQPASSALSSSVGPLSPLYIDSDSMSLSRVENDNKHYNISDIVLTGRGTGYLC